MSWIDELGSVYRKNGESYFVDVPLRDLDAVWPKLLGKGVTRISSITVNDSGKEFEVIYHFVYNSVIINIRTTISQKNPQIKSIISHYPGANLIERELWETMGVESVGHPELKNLLLDEKLSPKKPGLKEEKK